MIKDDCHLLVRGCNEEICAVGFAGIVGWIPGRVEVSFLPTRAAVGEGATSVWGRGTWYSVLCNDLGDVLKSFAESLTVFFLIGYLFRTSTSPWNLRPEVLRCWRPSQAAVRPTSSRSGCSPPRTFRDRTCRRNPLPPGLSGTAWGNHRCSCSRITLISNVRANPPRTAPVNTHSPFSPLGISNLKNSSLTRSRCWESCMPYIK